MSANRDGRDNDRPLSNRNRDERWQVDFPFGWDADDLVGRRQLLRWSVGVAGALFAMTGLLAGLGFARSRSRGEEQEVIAADELDVGGVHYFKYPESNEFAVLLRLEEDRFVAYSGICTHLSCEVYWAPEENQLICPCHNGRFEPETGEVIQGPPSRRLPRIRLENRNGKIYALEQEFANA